MNQGNIFIVTAPSGAGKTTLVSGLLIADHGIQLSVSHTTRTPREGERDGVDYHFVSHAVFHQMLEAGEFLESAEIYGNFYGTSHAWIRKQLQKGQDILLEIDWQGAKQVRQIFPQAIGIFILPPSIADLERRLRGRAKDAEEQILRRLRVAHEEMQHVEEFDYVIVNQHVDVAMRDIVSIIRAERLKFMYQASRQLDLMISLKQAYVG